MAMNVTKTFVSSLAKRYYGAAACAKSSSAKEIEVTTLPNKMIIASVDSPVPGLCKVAVAVRAGSKYETPDNYGVSHILRSSAGLSTACATHFAISKNIQQIGASFSATSDREIIMYMLETNKSNLETGLQFMKYAIVNQLFKPWELSDNVPRIMYELAIIPPQAKVIDLLHKAAYRTELGNSIFAKKYNVKKIGTETLQHFCAKNFLSNTTCVAGVGVNNETLSEFGDSLDFQMNERKPLLSKFHGGEIRMETDNELVHAVIAGEGCGLNTKNVFACAVLRHALGSGCNVKRGVGIDPLSKALSKFSGPVNAHALAIAHSNSGLFGVLISCTPETADKVAAAVMNVLKAGVTAGDVTRAKNQLKSQLLFGAESTDTLAIDVANQCVLMGGAKSPENLLSDIDEVTTDDVQKVLQKVLAGKKAMASIGKLYGLPYLDDLRA